MPRAAVYIRKSSESDDKQCLSLPAQREWALRTCARLGINDPLVFEEARSAKTPGRPEFGRMVAMVNAGQITEIVCWKADRLARNALDGGSVLYALEATKLTRIVTDDRIYNHAPDDELVLAIELGLSSKFSKDLSKNIRRGLEEKWRRGEWSSHAPVGYKNVREAADRSVIAVDPLLAPHVKALFKLAATGNYSINDLAHIARTQWRVNLSTYRRDGSKQGISPSAIHRILRNEFYYGAMRIKGQLYAGSHTPLVTKVTFDSVQAALTRRRTVAARPHRLRFAFTGLVRCASCGRRLVGYQKQKNGHTYRYYACSKRLRGLCTQPQLAEKDIDAAIAAVMQQLMITKTDHEIVKRMLAEAVADDRHDQEATQRRVAAELVDINNQRSRLVDLVVDGTLTREEYDRKQREIAERQAELTLAARMRDGEPPWLEPMETFFSGLLDAAHAFTTANDDGKRGLVGQMGLELEARDKKTLVHAGKPATILMNRGDHPLWWWIVQMIRNYFAIRVQIDGLLILNRRYQPPPV
ncbi:MAG TPA: recombinase family protein [Thermoanaerobaculia bacterium]|nr:recombinase family protein [Thermoanaerobaculia bacterium]